MGCHLVEAEAVAGLKEEEGYHLVVGEVAAVHEEEEEGCHLAVEEAAAVLEGDVGYLLAVVAEGYRLVAVEVVAVHEEAEECCHLVVLEGIGHLQTAAKVGYLLVEEVEVELQLVAALACHHLA